MDFSNCQGHVLSGRDDLAIPTQRMSSSRQRGIMLTLLLDGIAVFQQGIPTSPISSLCSILISEPEHLALQGKDHLNVLRMVDIHRHQSLTVEEHSPFVSHASQPLRARNHCSHRRQCQLEAYSYKMKRKTVLLFSQDNTEVEHHCSLPAHSPWGSKGFAVIQSQGEMMNDKLQTFGTNIELEKMTYKQMCSTHTPVTCKVDTQDS